MVYGTKQVGSKYSSSFKTYITEDGQIISPWHDIPLLDGELVNCVNEISRFEHGKFEINKKEKFNPITQDIKKGEMRFVHNIFPLYGYPFNYGALPQTWEDPAKEDSRCNAVGDNDPLDIVEIGTKRKETGEVYKAKVLGALALLDEGEADWKVFVIDASDDLADKINSLDDVTREFPELLENVFRWFRDNKIPDGKPANNFAFGGQYLDAETARHILIECHENWKRLMKNGHGDISLANYTLGCTNSHAEDFDCQGMPEAESRLPEHIHAYSFAKKSIFCPLCWKEGFFF